MITRKRAFGPYGGRAFGPYGGRAFGPYGGRAFGPSRSEATRRDATTKSISLEIHQKNGGNFWILRDPGKGYFERPEKVHFWKSQFQNLF
jgi:hypothetical protein